MSTILLDTFYKIDTITREGTSITAQVTFDKNHDIFKGHFPGMPVVPGVCETQMLGEVLTEAMGKEVVLKSAASIKFLSVIDPTVNPTIKMTITISQKEGEEGYYVSAQYGWEEKVFFKFKGKFGL